ncbi:MAG: hypothetical protein P8J18_10280 [Halieaceae bacterium]|nr:hypothetical protein [Halieaceae bacterium]
MRGISTLIILLRLSIDAHAVHECGSPHMKNNSIGHAEHGCDDLK